MTKKSLARQQRDQKAKIQEEFLEDNRMWDELKEKAQEIAKNYAEMVATFYQVYVNGDLYKYIPSQDQPRFKHLVDSLRLSMDQFSKDYEVIRKTHKDKSGSVADMPEMMVAIDLFEKYSTLWTLQVGSQEKDMQELATLAGKTIQTMVDTGVIDEEQARDPNVVTDVQDKITNQE